MQQASHLICRRSADSWACSGTEYVQRGMHYQDRIYDPDAPGLSEEQREVLSLPPVWHNESRHHLSPFTAPPKGSDGGAAKL